MPIDVRAGVPGEHRRVPAGALEQRNGELEILNSIASALNASVGLAASLGTALSRVAELLHLQTGWVWLLDERTGKPYLAAAQNLPAALGDHPERMEGRCHCLTAFGRGEMDSAANVFTCSRLEWITGDTSGLRFHASIPLHARGRRLGVMNVASTEWRELSNDELRLLHIVGEMLGVAIERSRLFERSTESGAAEERNRLAREIHDTLAQGLAATALQLETADALLEAGADAERVRAMLRQALETTRRNLDDARRSVLDLRPAPLQGRTLAEALRELCRDPSAAGRSAADAPAASLSAPGMPRLRLHTTGAARTLPARLEVGLYRVAREALLNALRHAGARHVSIRLHVEPDLATLSVEDDGRGFEVTRREPVRSEAFGMVGMCERIRLLGGEFTVESAPGAGTRVRAMVPLE